VARIL